MCRHWLAGYTFFKKKLFIHLYTNKPSAEKTGLYFSCIRVVPLGCTLVCCVGFSLLQFQPVFSPSTPPPGGGPTAAIAHTQQQHPAGLWDPPFSLLSPLSL